MTGGLFYLRQSVFTVTFCGIVIVYKERDANHILSFTVLKFRSIRKKVDAVYTEEGKEQKAMLYRRFQNMELSALGFGGLRFPVLNGDDGKINEAAAEEMIAYAMEQGINYYDTAWGYHEGNSELVLGKILSKYPREKFNLATKFPGYDLSNMSKVEEIFEKQLEKCRVSYFDFYLFHNVCKASIDAYLNPEYGIFNYLKKQRESGRIRHLGFSAHASIPVMKRFLDAYGEHMEFCQIQCNYIDWTYLHAKGKVELLNEYKIPVWVMEPVRGGRLANLSENQENVLKKMRPEESVVAWAFRFLQSQPDVVMVLSGMSNMQQLKENISTYKEDKPLSEAEMATLLEMAKGMLDGALPCTACRYCTTHCPKGLNIPSLLAIYNEHNTARKGSNPPPSLSLSLKSVPEDKQPSACIGCRSCEKVCPQNIKISEDMADFVSKLKI